MERDRMIEGQVDEVKVEGFGVSNRMKGSDILQSERWKRKWRISRNDDLDRVRRIGRYLTFTSLLIEDRKRNRSRKISGGRRYCVMLDQQMPTVEWSSKGRTEETLLTVAPWSFVEIYSNRNRSSVRQVRLKRRRKTNVLQSSIGKAIDRHPFEGDKDRWGVHRWILTNIQMNVHCRRQ